MERIHCSKQEVKSTIELLESLGYTIISKSCADDICVIAYRK